jgi:hypothetical protein
MAFGEGEREIVTLVLLLNIKMECKGLFDVIVHRFEGGVNSDRTPVFISVLDYVFPGTLRLQCDSHIIRKMKINDRNGNSTYFRQCEVNDEEWFTKVAFKDVQMMHLCRTDKMFCAYTNLVRLVWQGAKQDKL